ncbi:Ig-like domain-containing protein [Ohtaekwangia sp.]|uniref:Ig-like domain-containing protein n=1 Tax=Ohtaekwangia sp. TaxID=2066019 RepID=UPI002F93705B
MKHLNLFLFFFGSCLISLGQNNHHLVFPDSTGWNVLNENQELSFRVKISPEVPAYFTIEGTEDLNIRFDTLGNFSWKPSFDLVDRVAKTKDVTVIFQAILRDGKRERKPVTFIVNHVNRPPVVEDLPVFYVKQSNLNTYQIANDYVYDPDGDPIVVKSIQSQMPEGSSLSSLGQFTWTPSRSQFSSLKNNPLQVEFIVQDQPDKAETKGKLKIAQTQQDLPPEILVVPGDSLFSIKEDETLNLKIYISDPNGDDNVRSAGFVSSDKRVPASCLKENTTLQSEFTWTPGYEFVDDTQNAITTELIFFVLDKSNNRTQRKIRIKVTDAENLIKKDAHLYQKYRSNLVDALILIQQLDANQRKLNADYKKAKKGKKNRSIVNASLGAVTGFTPAVVDNADQSKVVSAVGGTTVLTLGTLEATEVVGRSKENILEKIKIGIDIRNKVQSVGDEFARKYALKSSRRSAEFDKDIEKLRSNLNDQRIVLLELDAYAKNAAKIDDKEIKKVFVDFADEQK